MKTTHRRRRSKPTTATPSPVAEWRLGISEGYVELIMGVCVLLFGGSAKGNLRRALIDRWESEYDAVRRLSRWFAHRIQPKYPGWILWFLFAMEVPPTWAPCGGEGLLLALRAAEALEKDIEPTDREAAAYDKLRDWWEQGGFLYAPLTDIGCPELWWRYVATWLRANPGNAGLVRKYVHQPWVGRSYGYADPELCTIRQNQDSQAFDAAKTALRNAWRTPTFG